MLQIFDTICVPINVAPKQVWQFVSDLKNWEQFSDFAKDIEQINAEEWVAHTTQGDVRVIPKFDEAHLLLDHICVLASGEEQLIPYRVVANESGAMLMMTNSKGRTSTDAEYAEQLAWMKQELESIKKILES